MRCGWWCTKSAGCEDTVRCPKQRLCLGIGTTPYETQAGRLWTVPKVPATGTLVSFLRVCSNFFLVVPHLEGPRALRIVQPRLTLGPDLSGSACRWGELASAAALCVFVECHASECQKQP